MSEEKLNSLGVSRVHEPTRTTKIVQLIDEPSWPQVKMKLEELARTGLLRFSEATRNRLVLRWEPRVFPQMGIRPQAEETLETVSFDLTLAFTDWYGREMFKDWLHQSGLLVES